MVHGNLKSDMRYRKHVISPRLRSLYSSFKSCIRGMMISDSLCWNEKREKLRTDAWFFSTGSIWSSFIFLKDRHVYASLLQVFLFRSFGFTDPDPKVVPSREKLLTIDENVFLTPSCNSSDEWERDSVKFVKVDFATDCRRNNVEPDCVTTQGFIGVSIRRQTCTAGINRQTNGLACG